MASAAPFSAAWMGEPGVRDLFRHFPLALALVEARSAARTVNERFEELLETTCLEGNLLRGVLGAPERAGQRLALPGRDGNALEVRAYAMRVPDGVLLVLDDTPESAGGAEVESLRARIVELERLSATDRLTGAWNRRHLDQTIETELSRSLRFRQPVTLVLLDIDHFKEINDRHGHPAGDAVLRELVAVMRGTTRTADLVFRWGGEEFVVLAASTGYRSGAILAEKLRAAVEKHAFPVVGAITVSAGVAEHIATESAESWFARLDAELYEAKRDGRNRVCVDRRGNSDAWSAAGATSALRLSWQESYECGEPAIDAQHRELFDLANTLIDTMSGRPAERAAVNEALMRLIAHVDRHFRDEEALLAKAGYTHLESHVRAHNHLRERALELKRAADEGKVSFGEVVDFLANEVVARHLFTADRDYFPLFAGRG
jgi:diguanylate cyclase (GGDEF)-like protein/hemerythrin-like metal-binding protein